ncbi:MAG: hypothetical protein CMK64_12655 [Pseudoalteromonas sp.]|nr:hypothetical protein [Pseudoalteromonas sp.]|tara:strand:+ start:5290 stop:5976 length:687 start_codon:yes stop_codon:yes gene_type:complete
MKELLQHGSDSPFYNSGSIKDSIDNLESIRQAEELTQALNIIAIESGYECLAFIDYAPLSTTAFQQHTYGLYSKDIETYLDYKELYEHSKSGIRLKPMSKLLSDRQALEGLYVLPLRGVPGIVGALIFNIPENFANFKSIELIDWHWTILSPYLLNAAMRCRKSNFKITKREKDCLLWASEGKTSWEISQILGITERTVNFHLANCIEKTQSANRQQAIVKCIINNVI